MMSQDDHKIVVVRFFEKVWNAQDLDVTDELLAPAYLGHERNAADTHGPIGMRQAAQAFHRTFAEARFTIVDAIADADRVVLHLRVDATHAATSRPIAITGMVLYRLRAGKIAESWSNWDELGMLQQLGGQIVGASLQS
jgi:predicted ester cyclase